jgi:HK97 family phage portal protein
MKLPFGLEVIKGPLKPVGSLPAITEEKEKSVTSYMKEIQGFGMRLSAYDYAKDTTTLTEIAKYNPWIASSIRAITRNSIQPIGQIWDPKTEKEVKVPEFEQLMIQPHPLFTQAKFRKYVNFYYAYFGIAFIYKIRMDNKRLIALQPLPSDRVQMNPALLAKGIIAWQLNNGAGLIDLPDDDLIVWMDDEFIDSYYTGGSKINHLLFSVANKNGADRFNKSTIENGGEFKGVLYTEQRLGEADIDLYQKQLKKRYGGADNAGKTAVLGSGLKYEKTGATIAEMAFDKLQQVSREEVLAIFKVPPVELGLTDSVNYANAKEQRKLFWETTLVPTFDSLASAISRDVLQKEFKTTYEYYFDYSAIPAMQQDLNTKLQSGLTMQLLGYDNETITSYLDLPKIKEAPETNIIVPEQKSIIIPNRFKSVFRDSAKELFGKSHLFVEIQFRRAVEKHFLNWRNDVLDQIKKDVKDEMSPKDKLLSYIDKRIGIANSDLKKLGVVMYAKVNDNIVKKLIDQYGLKWVESSRNIITTSNHLDNFTLVNATVDEQLKEAIKEAYLKGLQNNYSSGEMADAFINATKGVYKLADNRALLIARTETTSMSNDLMLDQYHENEVEKREWLTARDGDVRSIVDGAAFDHVAMDGQKAKLMESFKGPGCRRRTF